MNEQELLELADELSTVADQGEPERCLVPVEKLRDWAARR